MLPQYFYSDPHWGHSNIIRYCSRPFKDVKEMNYELTRRYNEKVKPSDTVLWCGDCIFAKGDLGPHEILSGLNGHKILIKGNHDKSEAVMAEWGFDLVLTEAVLHIAGRTCRVSHFPYEDIEHSREGGEGARRDKYRELRPKRRKGEVLIHGHTHSPKKVQGNCIHVGVDAWDYAPVSMAEVEALVAKV